MSGYGHDSGLPEGATFIGRGRAASHAPASAYASLKEETHFCPRCRTYRPTRDFRNPKKSSTQARRLICNDCGAR